MQRAWQVARHAVLVACICSLAACAARRQEGVTVSREGVRFQMRQPAATSVAVAGDFNSWSPTSDPMTLSGDIWMRRIPLPPGHYVFMYVVDGMTWVTPANVAETVPDGFGGLNGRVVVP